MKKHLEQWLWKRKLARLADEPHSPLRLDHGSRVGVIGGGPAGSLSAFFLLDLAQRLGTDLHVDLYEARDFTQIGPAGCNMCGGIVSESLVQALATEGIILPPEVVTRGIDSYVMHTDVGVARIDTPLQEMRIAAVHRGAGPRGLKEARWRSFDAFLVERAVKHGAHLIRGRVDEVTWAAEGRFQIKIREGTPQIYDLLVVATGINTGALKLFENLGLDYRPPPSTKTFITEFFLGAETLRKYFGNSMHVFLLNLPRLEFAALIPKGDFLTFCLLGQDIDDALVKAFLDTPEVRRCFPPDWQRPPDCCRCSPRISVAAAAAPFADRLVFVGDCGVSRLYKDGIGAAYRAAKAAAVTAVFHGIARADFQRHYWPLCCGMTRDNRIGKLMFAFTRLIQVCRFLRVGILRMVAREQQQAGGQRRMSMVLWDMFTGSAPYGNVFVRTLHPCYWGRLVWETLAGLFHRPQKQS